MKEINIDGKIYVPEGTKTEFKLVKPINKYPYKIIRTYSAGVFAGYLKERKGKEAVILNARRLWYWEGANSLSQLAMEGTKSPDKCKFPCEVSKIEVTEVIEILDVTEQAKQSMDEVPIWKK